MPVPSLASLIGSPTVWVDAFALHGAQAADHRSPAPSPNRYPLAAGSGAANTAVEP